jgi:L-lactate dehydrogenase complex protein LldG
MSSRDAILSRIRNALANDPERPLPPVPEVWPRENPAVDAMAARFQRELEDVHGEVIRCRTMEDARSKLAEMAVRESWEKIGVLDRPLCRDVSGALPPERTEWARRDWTPQSMAGLSAGVVEADYLLADTGSSMVACGEAVERLMCYLPPACVIVATTDRLVEHLPAAWPEIANRAADPQVRGEFVFITGPSRTADIEKILILGVHGPKRLTVLLVDVQGSPAS